MSCSRRQVTSLQQEVGDELQQEAGDEFAAGGW